MAAIQTLVDYFNQTSLQTGLWTQFTAGSATIGYDATGVTVSYPAASTSSTDGDISSNTTYDLTGSRIDLHVITVPSAATSADAELRVFTDASNWFRWIYEAGTLYAQRRKAGTSATIFSVAYNSSTHAYWRITESGGTVTWWTSLDRVTWTSQGTYVHGMTITAMKVLIAALCFQAETNPGTFKWNNLSIAPMARRFMTSQAVNRASTY